MYHPNSGSLPSELTVEDLKKPHTSFPANPFVANILYLADYTQRAGSGMLEMIEQCKAQHVPEPEFVLIRNVEFRTILPRDYVTDDFLSRMEVNERQTKAIKYIKERGVISRKEYVELTEISPRMAHLDLTDLVRKKIIVAAGKGRSVKYKLHK